MEPQKSEVAAEAADTMMAACFTVDEETSMELSKLLESFGPAPPPVKVRFIDDPYSPAVVFQSSSAYVTINGNEETCGSSFSDSDSSVMASIDLGGALRFLGRGASFSDSDSSVMASINLGRELRFLGSGAWVFSADEAREWRNDGSAGNAAEAEIDLNDFLMDDFDYGGGGGDEDATWKEFLGEEILGSV